MQLLDIKDLRTKKQSAYTAPTSHRQHQQQQQFQLLMKQALFKLPVEPILAAHPQMAEWLNEVRSLLPSLFRIPADKLHLDATFSHAIAVNGITQCIQVHSNAVYKKQKIILIDWAIRKPEPAWGDKVKLWVASEYLSVEPSSLSLIVLAVHAQRPANKLIINWTLEDHKKTRRQVIKALKASTDDNQTDYPAVATSNNVMLMPLIAEICEVPI